MAKLLSSKGTHKSKVKCMAEGGVTNVEGDRGDRSRERVYSQNGADPRTGLERVAGLINRVVSGNKDAPVRKYDDTTTRMAMNRRASQKKR